MDDLKLKVSLDTKEAIELMEKAIELAADLKKALDTLNATKISIDVVRNESTPNHSQK